MPVQPSPPASPPQASSPVTAVVPLKALDRAKGRLAGALEPDARRLLARVLFARVLDATQTCPAIGEVVAVVGDEEGAALAADLGATTVLRDAGFGLADALAVADAATRDAPATLVVAADLPLVTAGDLDLVCAAGLGPDPVVVVAPTTDGGTGALLRRPAAVVGTAYGPGSARAHVRLAAAAGVRSVVLDVPGLALDVDTPSSLRAAAAAVAAGQDGTSDYQAGPGTRTLLDVARSARGAHDPQEHADMPQGTVKHFDLETHTGSLLLDNADELPFDAAAFASSGLIELRLGQRVRFRLDRDGDVDTIRNLGVVSM